MEFAPDPDWYVDHVLAYAEPGGAPAPGGPAARWQAWWKCRWQDAAEAAPARLARDQGFVLTTAQARSCGWTANDLRREVRRGRWSAPARGVVSPVTVPADGEPQRAGRRRHALAVTAAALRRRDQVVTARSAAILHGLPTLAVPATPELTARRAITLGHRTRAHVHCATLRDCEIGSWFGAPVGDVARTVLDLARHDRRDAVMAADAALRENLVTRAELDSALDRVASWPYARQARSVLALATDLAESPLESVVRLALHDAGFPAPELQAEIDGFRVDFLWRRQRVILEADGKLKYSGDELWREKRREMQLRRLGFVVVRITWPDLLQWREFTSELAAELRCYLPGVGS
jgi:very-short-patch-repair endonuclease